MTLPLNGPHHKWWYSFKYSGIDGLELYYEMTGTYVNICQERSFQYIRDFILTGKWPIPGQDYIPTYIDDGRRKSEPLVDATMFYQNSIETTVVRNLANRCAADETLAENVIKEAAKVVKTRDASAKMEWNNIKRRLREHKKRGKMLNLNYMEIIRKYQLFSISDFSYEAIL